MFKKEGPSGYLKGNLIALGIILPIYFYFIKNYISFKFNKSMLKNAFSFSAPIIPALLFYRLVGLSDRVFIDQYLTLNDIGLYAFSYTIAGVLINISAAFSLTFEPEYFRLANLKKTNKSKKKIFDINRFNINSILLISFF